LEDLAKKFGGVTDDNPVKNLRSAFSTSAKEGTNVEKTFETLGHLLLSDSERKDPVKKICEVLRSTGIRRNVDVTTPIGALDAIIVDFCDGFTDSRMAMILVRQEIVRAGIDISNPSKKGILNVVEYLAEAEYEFIDEEKVFSNLERRREMAESIIE
jgi:hypothetical protein